MLGMPAKDESMRLRRYREFVALPDSEQIRLLFGKRKQPSIFGGDEFISCVRGRFFKEKRHKEVPESKSLAPDTDAIKEAACRFYEAEENGLKNSRRGAENEPRDVAIYLLRTFRGQGLMGIGSEFNLNNFSSVSSVVERVRKRRKGDRKFRVRVKKVEEILEKGQTKI